MSSREIEGLRMIVEGALINRPYGVWSRCSCAHIAQEHDEDGICTAPHCRCEHYDGKVVQPLNPSRHREIDREQISDQLHRWVYGELSDAVSDDLLHRMADHIIRMRDGI